MLLALAAVGCYHCQLVLATKQLQQLVKQLFTSCDN